MMKHLSPLALVLLASCAPRALPDVVTDVPSDASSDVQLDAGRDVPDVPPAPDVPLIPCASCTAFARYTSTGRVSATSVIELSGLAASEAFPGVLWAHNDSGDTARVFALATDGALRGEFTITNATADDWEDIALAPCGATHCLLIGDIGDNAEDRTDTVIYRVPEPASLPVDPAAPVALTAEVFRFRYPDGSHDAEALVPDPHDGTVAYIITKSFGNTVAYSVPLTDSTTTATATRLGQVALPPAASLVTGADAHPCASAVILRTYGTVFLCSAPEGSPFAAALTSPCTNLGPQLPEGQGEAVAFARDGRSYFTASEGERAEIHHVSCVP